jgi:DNA-binding CsgD family transcriptional regulator
MEQPLKFNYLDFAHIIGKKHYIFLKGEQLDLKDLLEKNPLIQGILNIGPYFMMLGNVHTWETLYISDGCEKITGYSVEEAYSLGPQLLVNFTHPEDYPVAMETNQMAIKKLYQAEPKDRPFFSCVFYHRGINKNGEMLNIMQQTIPVAFDLQENPYIFAIIITDITHLQMPRLPKTVLINHKKNDYQLIEPGNPIIDNQLLHFSKRESEVLRLLAEGFTTKEIALQLRITFHTAATYRKRLREKTKVKNTTELVNYALVQALL